MYIYGVHQCYHGGHDISPYCVPARLCPDGRIEVKHGDKWETLEGYRLVTCGSGEPFTWPLKLPLNHNLYRRVPVVHPQQG